MATSKQLKEIAEARLKAGCILLAAGDADLAVDCFGLALELILKASICKTLNLENYPDQGTGEVVNIFRTHTFDVLLILTGFDREVTGDKRKRLFENWSKATSEWSASKKYEPMGTKTKADADRMYKALTEEGDGVKSWVYNKNQW